MIVIVYGNFSLRWPSCMITVAGPVFVTWNEPGGGGGGSVTVVGALACWPVDVWTVLTNVPV